VFRNLEEIVFEGESKKSDTVPFPLSTSCQTQPENAKRK